MNRFLLLTLVLLLGSCGLKVGNIDLGKIYDTTSAVTQAAKTYTVKEEVEFGNSIAAQLLGASKYYANESVQQYVSNIGQWLVMQLPEQKYDWHFVVLEDEMFNAYAAPGGMIFVNTGMLEQLNTEAQLAAILAHEIIHAYRSHHVNTIQKTAKSKAWSNALSLANDQRKNKDDKGIKIGREVWESVADQVTNIYFRGFDKELEFAADYQGIFLLSKAGYDPYAMIEVLQLIQGIESEDVWFKQFYDTHPDPADRLKIIFETAEQSLGHLSPVAILESRYQNNKPR